MTYKVILQDAAAADAREYAAFLLDQSKNAKVAVRWLEQLEIAVASLKEMPKRYKIIAEQDAFALELRQLLHYSHRIVYHVDDTSRRVHVLRIYHGARKPMVWDDLNQ